MNANDIINLVNAGFTKNEIMKMFNFESEQKEPEQKEPEQKEPDTSDVYKLLLEKLDNLGNAIKNNNFRAEMPFSPTNVEAKADEFFANIIAPKESE